MIPNPIDWVVDEVTGIASGVAAAGFELVLGGLVAWVVDAVVWVVGGVFGFFLDSTDPNVQAAWFVTGTGPYATTVAIGGALLLLFLLAGIVQGTFDGDVGGMLRRMALDLPISVLGMFGLVTVTQALIRLTDVLSVHVLTNFRTDITTFTTGVATLSALTSGASAAFVVFVLGLVAVLTGLILVAELVVRSALIYIVVALAPLMFAARVWPATKGATRRLLELLCALILSKLVIAVALAVAAAAAVGAGAGGAVTALPEPEVFVEDPGGSVTQAVGILLTAAAAFGVAAFSPLLITRLLPLTEAAVVAQGVRGGPVRAGQQGLMMANTAQMVSGHRLNQLASGRTSGGGTPGAGAGTRPSSFGSGGVGPGAGGAAHAVGGGSARGGAAGGVAGGAGAAAATAGTAAKGAVATGARASQQVAEESAAPTAPAERPAPPPDQRSHRDGRATPPRSQPAPSEPPKRPGRPEGGSSGK